MKEILSQDQHAMGLYESSDGPIVKTRLAARGVVRDANGRIGLMYFPQTGSYKLPGGGIDEGESELDAFHREIREETGYLVTNVEELGIVEEDRYFCGIHQTSYCYTAVATKYVGTELTDGEKREGMTLRWVTDIDEAIQCIKQGKVTAEGEPEAGLAMMKTREIAILKAATGSLV